MTGLPGDDRELQTAFLSHLPLRDETLSGDPPYCIEVGTRRWDETRPTAHRDWFDGCTYRGVDMEAGTDVDVVDDCHTLAKFDDATVDAFLAVSVFEHLARPWDAAEAIARVVAPGGVAYIDTHQSFPVHGYPHDYFRFSLDALHVLFPDEGWQWLAGKYHEKALICPTGLVEPWNDGHEAWLNVGCVLKRRKP